MLCLDPRRCPDGTYENNTGASTCTLCPPGYYCSAKLSTVTYFDCPQGYYCPIGTGLNWTACPVGKYGSRSNLRSEDDCTGCDAGKFCSRTALSAPNGNCSAGFFCPYGSQNSWGGTVYTSNSTCTAGSYCPKGSSVPLQCPPGTYNPNRGSTSLEQCLSCPPGRYCDRYNLTAPAGVCATGYYCTRGAYTPRPVAS